MKRTISRTPTVKRVTVQIAPTVDEDLGRVVDQEPAPGQSRAVRDAARDLLG
jgi:metal-responsive CopG/Arc/MetJ family transcriptional regulator